MERVIDIGPTNSEKLLNTFKSSPESLIAVTHPTCTHCKTFKPVFKKLCKDIIKDPKNNFIILNVHSDNVSKVNNQIPEFKIVDGVPTVFAVKTGKKPSLYEGNNDYESLRKFVNNTLGTKLKTEKHSRKSHRKLHKKTHKRKRVTKNK